MRLPLLGLMALGLACAGQAAAQDAEATEHGAPPGFHSLKIGDRAPDFSLPGTDGRTYSLADFGNAPVLAVVFLSNHCPASHAAETRLLPFVRSLEGRGLAVVAINPNSSEGLRLEELGYSRYGDSFEEMKLYARERRWFFPYLYDGATQAVAQAYGCLCTPHLFVFDRDRRLRYKGRFDDSQLPDAASVHASEGAEAIKALLDGRPVPVAVTRPMGCSTKWATKQGTVADGNEAWARIPVTLGNIDDAGIRALARNDSGRLRVINLWATWCVPCVEEFPGLVALSRRFETRDIDFITVSVDSPADRPKALAFLNRVHAAVPPGARAAVARQGRSTNSFIYTGLGADALAQALDPKWPGGYPYTIVIAPGGEVLERYTGAVDPEALKVRLLDRMGVYYK